MPFLPSSQLWDGGMWEWGSETEPSVNINVVRNVADRWIKCIQVTGVHYVALELFASSQLWAGEMREWELDSQPPAKSRRYGSLQVVPRIQSFD
jgi:hypothetical protein